VRLRRVLCSIEAEALHCAFHQPTVAACSSRLSKMGLIGCTMITVLDIRGEVEQQCLDSATLRMTLDDPEAFNSKISSQLDPNLVDQLTAYAASRNVPLSQTVLKALELFMLSAAEDAWHELSNGAESEANFSAAPLTFILERFLTISLDPSRQRLIEGPGPPSILNHFRRMPE
jgi:hypothetical protein